MRLTCACGICGSIELFTDDEHARRFGVIAAGFPAGVGTVAVKYIGLFRPAKRGLAWNRACKLLDELRQMIEDGEVERRGRCFPASPALFASAMQQMLDTRERLELPLTSHGYLIAIVAGDSPREAARAESAAEELKRMASRHRDGTRSLAVAELSAEIARRKRFGEQEMTDEDKQEFLRQHGVAE